MIGIASDRPADLYTVSIFGLGLPGLMVILQARRWVEQSENLQRQREHFRYLEERWELEDEDSEG